LVIVHLNKLIQIDAVKIKDATKMVSENKVISQFNNSLDVVWIVLFKQQEQLGLNCSLVIIFFLVLHQLYGNQLFMFMIQAFDDLPKCSFTDDLYELESIGNVISLLYAVISLFVVEAVVDKPFELGGPVFEGIFC